MWAALQAAAPHPPPRPTHTSSPAQAPHLQVLHREGSPPSRQVDDLDGPRGPDRAGAPEGLQARRLPLEHLPGLRPEQRRELGPQQGPLQPGCGSRLRIEAATWDHGHTGPQLPRAGWGRGPRPADSRCTWPLRLERGCKGEAELGLWVDRMLTAPREHLL